MNPTVLFNWRLDCRHDGTIYCIGDTPYGNRWETTQVLKMVTCEDHYYVTTRNSNYVLYW
jgi:hypothetical protein